MRKSVKPSLVYIATTVDEGVDVPTGVRVGLARTLSGVALNQAGMCVLLTQQTDKKTNGLWEVTATEWNQLCPSVGGNHVVLVAHGEGTLYYRCLEMDWGTSESRWELF